MKYLFVLHFYSHTRHFHTLFEELLRRGHELHVMGLANFDAYDREAAPPAHAAHIKPLTFHTLLRPRSDFWGRYADALRASRNFLLYNHPCFNGATVFKERASGFVDPFLARHVPPVGRRPPRWLTAFHRLAERAIPSSPHIEAFLKEHQFNAVLVSPLIFNEMLLLNDWVKSCRALGIPVGFPVFSWDNLTTKGTLHEMPDRIFVWNEAQRREAIELHGWDEAIIEVCGGWRFDEFTVLEPSVGRERFLSAHGLDPSKRTIVYIGSAPIVAPREAEFVAEWVKAIRSSPDPEIRGANIFIRPHPRNVAAWKRTAGIRRWPRVVLQDVRSTSLFQLQMLYDIFYHSDAVVGLITSALIEAALVRKPIHSVLTSVAGEGQRGTVHFEYLTATAGGLLYLASSLDDHLRRLGGHLRRPPGTPDPRAEAFVGAFIDSPRAGVSSTAVLADAIDDLAARRRVPRRDGATLGAVRIALAAALRTGLLPIGTVPAPDPAAEGR